jgi:hypothetical protein
MLVFLPLGNHQVTDYLYRSSCSPQRLFTMVCTPTSRGLSSLKGYSSCGRINRMEREMCEYLEWELNVDSITLREFEDIIRKDFDPIHILPSTKKSTPPPTAHPPAAAQSFAVVRSVLSIATQIDPPQNPSMAHMPPPPNYPSDNTPSPSYSPSSPALSASPPTPPGIEDSGY